MANSRFRSSQASSVLAREPLEPYCHMYRAAYLARVPGEVSQTLINTGRGLHFRARQSLRRAPSTPSAALQVVYRSGIKED